MSDDHKRFSLFDDTSGGGGDASGGSPGGASGDAGGGRGEPDAWHSDPEPAPTPTPPAPNPPPVEPPSAASSSPPPPWPSVVPADPPSPAPQPPEDVSSSTDALPDRPRRGRRGGNAAGGSRSVGRVPKPAPWPDSWEEPIPPQPPMLPSSGHPPRNVYPLDSGGYAPMDTQDATTPVPGIPSLDRTGGDPRYRPAASPAQRRLDADEEALAGGRVSRRGAIDYPPPPPPVRPPPAYQPFSTGTPVSRGVAFKRPQDIERRNLAVPIAGIVLVLLGLGVGIWLLGIIGGPDKGPTRTQSPKPTIGGVAESPSSSAGQTAIPSLDTSLPTDSGEPFPSDQPTDVPTDQPTDEPTPTPTRTPRKTTPPPSATPTANPTPTPPPGLPGPEPTSAPAGFPHSPGDAIFKVDLGDADFSGGKSGTYAGRSAKRIYGSGTSLDTISGRFTVSGALKGTARLRIVGQDSGDGSKTRIRIKVNGTTIFEGSDPLSNGAWTAAAFDFSASALKAGTNRITISNIESGSTQGPPFVALDSARLFYATP